VLPLDKFTVMIPEPHATLQGAVTWRNQCHDRATLEGVRISSAILKIVFRHILLIFKKCSLGFDERRRIVSDTLVSHAVAAKRYIKLTKQSTAAGKPPEEGHVND